MFNSLRDLVKTVPVRSRRPEAIIALQIRQIAKESLFKICADLPKEVLDSARVSSFKNGVLLVKAPHLLATELQMRSSELVDDINRTIGKKAVFKLRFKIS